MLIARLKMNEFYTFANYTLNKAVKEMREMD